jgi:glycosyltransferase involved in cell wall biosynthesis
MVERLTVLVPARNAEKTIRTAVSSVLRGLPHDGKLLVLDDASTDATGEILAGLARADGRVGVLTSEAQMGVAKALNALIDAADTPLIGRMDADDIALPWRFHRQIRAMYRGNLDAVFSPIILFGPSPTSVVPQSPLSIGPAASPYELLLTCALMHSTLVGRRSTIVDAGCYRRVPAEDWDLWIRLALRGARLGRIALPALLYRRHAEQVTASKVWQKQFAHAAETAKVHQELSQRLFGFSEPGAYAALTGSWAEPKDVGAAMDLIKAVRKTANRFPLSERVSMLATARLAKLRMRGIYGTAASA